MKSKTVVIVLVALLLSTSIVISVSSISGASTTTSDAIRIDSNEELVTQAIENGWPGDGSASDPFIISGLVIDRPADGAGIFIGNTTLHLLIVDCTISNSTYIADSYRMGCGIEVYQASNITVNKNVVRDCIYGIFLAWTHACNVSANTIISTSTGIEIINSTSNAVYGNDITRSMDVSILTTESTHIDIRSNSIIDTSGVGIRMDLTSHSDVFNNNMPKLCWGVFLYWSSFNNISKNYIGEAMEGIYLHAQCNDNVVKNNIISQSGDGIYVFASLNNNIKANVIDYPDRGIRLENANCNTVSNNTIDDARMDGILLFGSSANDITFNSVNHSKGYGIKIMQKTNMEGYVVMESTNNNILLNVFTYNNQTNSTYDASRVQAYDDGANNWNSSRCGNYWSDWQLSDANGDAVVAVPYSIDGDSNKDKLPVVPEISVTSPTNSQSNPGTSYLSLEGATIDPFGVEGVEWYNDLTKAKGNCMGTETWSANIELAEGVNLITVTAIDSMELRFSKTISVLFDSTSPTIAQYSPMGIAVALDSVVQIIFSEAMNQSSVSIVINGVTGNIAWEGNTISLVPPSMLSYGTSYTVQVCGKDLAGNAVDYSWTFSTVSKGTIEGVVTDPSGNPLADVTVTLENGLSTTTNANGHFAFNDVAAGTYDVTIFKEGYQEFTKSITVDDGKKADLGSLSVQSNQSSSPSSPNPTSSNDGLIMVGVLAILAAIGVALFLSFRKGKNGV